VEGKCCSFTLLVAGKEALPWKNLGLLATIRFGLEYKGSHNQVNSYICSYNSYNVPHIHAHIISFNVPYKANKVSKVYTNIEFVHKLHKML